MTREELNAYAMRVSQASKTQIIVIMYEVAIQYIDDACKAMDAGDTKEFRQDVKKAKEFINELSSSLDMQYEISLRLASLYTYFNNVCVRADIRLESEELKRVRAMLSSLKNAFEQVSGEDKSGPVMLNTQKVYTGLTYSKNSLNDNYANYSDINRGYKV